MTPDPGIQFSAIHGITVRGKTQFSYRKIEVFSHTCSCGCESCFSYTPVTSMTNKTRSSAESGEGKGARAAEAEGRRFETDVTEGNNKHTGGT